MSETNRQNRPVLWALLLIVVGTVFLLSNFDLIPRVSLFRVISLWPLFLIAVGLDLVLGKNSPYAGYLIAGGLVVAALVLSPFLPDFQGSNSGELQTFSFSEEVGEATSAAVTLDLKRYPTSITSSHQTGNLIDANLESVDEVAFAAVGSDHKRIQLGQWAGPQIRFGFQGLFDNYYPNAEWNIALDDSIPIDLVVDMGSGRANMDMAELNLSSLEIDGGSGRFDASLPSTENSYELFVDGGSGSYDIQVAAGANVDARVDVGSGSMDFAIAEGASVSLDIDGGSGRARVEVADNSALRLVVRDSGSGNVSVAGWLVLVDDMNDNDPDTGIWESPSFNSSTAQIEIFVDPGSGAIIIE